MHVLSVSEFARGAGAEQIGADHSASRSARTVGTSRAVATAQDSAHSRKLAQSVLIALTVVPFAGSLTLLLLQMFGVVGS